MKVGTVNFSPAPSTYTTPKTVTMSTATPGATIRYTTDGSAPTSSSSAYTGPITIATSTVLKATGFKTDWSNSAEASGTYTMNFGTLAAPSADQATGSYVHSVTVSLSSIAGATIRYTSDNSSVQVNSPIYTAALVFDVTTTLRFKGYHPDYQPSPEVTRVYTLSPAAPVFDPGGGSYPGGQVVTISGMTSGATMRYTINGVEPTAADQPIASGASLVVGNYTLKAKAFKSGTTPSATTSATYLVSGSVSAPVLAAGVDYSLAIRSDGTAWGWGQNVSGQTGAGNTTSPQRLPKIINGVTGAAAISGGTEHTQIVTTSGNVAGFGGNGNGRIGDGTTTARLLPTAVTGVSSIVGIAAGHGHTVALKGDGTVSAWGANTDGQVGDGTTTDRVSPTSVSGLSSVVEVSAGSSFSLARKQNGTVVSWGRNYYGQLGNGNNTGSSLPVSVSTISTATGISAGWLHALALLADGTVRAWGYNYYGQLGDGTTTHRNAPVEVAGLDDVVVVRAGTGFSLALKADGTVWAWGENNYGQLGDGTTTPHSSPAQVSDLTGIVAIAAGSSHALAMSSDGTVYAWGRNASGQLGDGTTTQKLTPFQISGAGMTWRVPAPTLSLASGLFYANQTVTVTSLDPNATLRYTTTGVDPTSSDATVTSGGTISITQSQTLKVNAWRTGAVTSLVVSGVYELKAVVPTLTPGAGAYGTAQNVSMATTTSGATPRYTTDGTEPTESSTAYSSAIVVANPLTVKVRAYKAGWTPSDSGYASYVISGGTVATPVITPAGGAQSVPPLVAMTSTTTGATIRYTVDGSTPTATSAVFVYPFLLTSTTTVKAKAFKAGYTASATASTTFNVDAAGAAATPQISPAGGWFATQQIVTITGATGQTLRYTTDGSDPTTSSTLIASGGTISVDKSQVLKVRAWESSLAPSAIRRGDFIVTGAVAAGVSHSVALASNGAVWTWGSNFNGQLGAGSSYTGSVVPVQVLTAVMAINAGAHHTLAVKTDGTVWTWGSGGYGALGNGHTGTTGTFWTPSQIAFTGGIAVAGGMAHSLVLKADGTVWAFGKNEYGELGDGTTTMRATPVQVVGLTGIVAIAASRGSSYALQSDGGSGGILWAWGANHYGQLGDGSTATRLTPIRVLGIVNASAISAAKAGYAAAAIGGDGRPYAWGRNNVGQLGDGTTVNRASAVAMPTVVSARVISEGTEHGVVVDAAARSWSWGSAYAGALGIGPVAIYQQAIVPQQSDIGGVLHVAAGDAHTLAVQPGGGIRAFGDNTSGKLGDGTTTQSIVGVAVSSLSLSDNTWLTGDPDVDDLPTWREYLAGTDPLNADTNGNGILDGHDDAIGANGLDPDSDDDGVPNWIEQKNGTDPFLADSDGDGSSDFSDAFPLDASRHLLPSSNPSDTTPPAVLLHVPVGVRSIP